MSEEVQGSLYYVIPAQVMHDPNLSLQEKMIYALVSGLANKYGHCFASNEWLCKETHLQERVIQNILSKIEKNGYIQREIICDPQNPMRKKRKIYINHSFKKQLPPPSGFTSGHESGFTLEVKQDSPILSEQELLSEKSCSVPGGEPPGDQAPKSAPSFSEKEVHESEEAMIPSSSGKVKKISKQDIITRSLREKKDWNLQEIQEAWNILRQQKLINDEFHFIDGTIKNIRNKKNLQKFREKTKEKDTKCQQTTVTSATDTEIQAAHSRARSGNALEQLLSQNPHYLKKT